MAEKTKKELLEEIEELTRTNEVYVREYEALMNVYKTETQTIQQVARDRLVMLKVFEGFFNTVNGAVNRCRAEFQELQTPTIDETMNQTEEGDGI
mgnify:CR=1 FL=1